MVVDKHLLHLLALELDRGLVLRNPWFSLLSVVVGEGLLDRVPKHFLALHSLGNLEFDRLILEALRDRLLRWIMDLLTLL